MEKEITLTKEDKIKILLGLAKGYMQIAKEYRQEGNVKQARLYLKEAQSYIDSVKELKKCK